MTITHEPGSIRAVHYFARKVGGQYPVTRWGTLDEQIAEATQHNASTTSRRGHDTLPLYTYSDHCPHSNPEDDDRYRDVDDLLDEWMRRNTPGLTWRDGALYSKNRQRGEHTVPLYVEWRQAQDAYDDVHPGRICLDSPVGTCCQGCAEGDEDWGFAVGSCRLPEHVREAYDEFWWRVSPDGILHRAAQEPAAS